MGADVLTIDKNMPYKQVARLLAENDLSAVPVVSGGGRVLGMVSEADVLRRELEQVDVPAEILGRAKHFYSIYDKMVKKGREFNEIYDLTAMRVIVERDGEEGTRDCYGALGLIHSLWKPMPGRFKDYVAMPKFNLYRSLHTTVIGPEGRPLEIQVRTHDMHRTAEFGIAAHWGYKEQRNPAEDLVWLQRIVDWQKETTDPTEFMQSLKIDLEQDEVFVFTPKGDVVDLPTAFYVTAVQVPHSEILGQFPTASGGEHFGMVFAKDNPLAGCVDNVLARLKASGGLKWIQRTWLAKATGAPVLK